MRTRLLLAAAILAVVPIQAAAQAKDAPKPEPKKSAPAKPAAAAPEAMKKTTAATCTGALCAISVSAPSCAVAADPDMVRVKTRNAVIRWTIATEGFTFAQDGIFFKTAGHETEFEQCRRVNDRTWECKDKNTKGVVGYNYGIKLVKPDKTACPTLDPTIINDP